MDKKIDFVKVLKELEEINQWFQGDNIDLEEGLEKLKRGTELIKKAKERLNNVENQFTNIKKDLNSDNVQLVE